MDNRILNLIQHRGVLPLFFTLLALLSACERSIVCRESAVFVDTEVDFALWMREGRCNVPNPALSHLEAVEIGGVRHWALSECAPCRIEFPGVFIGPDAQLEFAIGMLPSAREISSDGVRFEVAALLPDRSKKILYSRSIDPGKNVDERQWIPERVSIQGISDITATIVFETSPCTVRSVTDSHVIADSRTNGTFWAEPRLVSKGRREAHIPHPRPNVLLITLDTVRADHLGCYGNDWIQTPTLDRLAREGVLFENAYTVNYHTNPSHVSILTSLSPFAHGVLGNQQRLVVPLPCLPQIMKELDYTTLASISAYHLDNFMEGLGKWFDCYDKALPRQARPASMMSSLAIQRLQQVHNQPFFYWIHYYDCHQPYLATGTFHRMYYKSDPSDPANVSMENVSFPEDWDTQSPTNWMRPYTDLDYFRREYAAEVTLLDDQLIRVFDALRSLDLDKNTLVILVADHGEGLGEHGIYFDHWSQFNNDIRVPLILFFPGRLPAGKRIPALVSTLDIAPTILDLIGEKENFLAQKLFEGRSLRPLWESGESSRGERITGFTNGPYYIDNSAYDERYKVIWELQRKVYNRDYQTLTDRVWVYDMEKDPQEKNPVACFYWGDTPERVDPWQTELKEKPPVLGDKDFQRTKERVRQKKVPSPDELRMWFLEQNGRDTIRNEYRDDMDFFKRVVILMEKAKQTVNPPTVLDRMRDMPDILSQLGARNQQIKSVEDPVMSDYLRSLGYAGN